MSRTLPALALFFGFALAAIPALAEPLDRVWERGVPAPREGRIVEETFAEVRMEVPGAILGVPLDRVERIEWAGPPASFAKALEFEAAGRWQAALEVWRKLDGACRAGQARAVFRPHALWHAARAANLLELHAEAAETARTLFRDFPATGHWLPAAFLWVDATLAGGKREAAQAVARERIEAARSLGLTEELRLEAELLEPRARAGPEAAAEYRLVARRAARFPRVVALAKLGQARALLLAGRLDEAEAAAAPVAEQPLPPLLIAEAHATLAEIDLARHARDRNPDRLRAALLHFLRGVVQYPPDQPSEPGRHGQSLLGAGWCFEQLGGAPCREHARRLYAQASERYADRAVGKEADRRLEGMR